MIQRGWASLSKNGESATVEFKASLPPDGVSRDLIAFANSKGGVLIVGVDDDSRILGLPDAEAQRTVERLKQLSASLCEWSTRIGIAEVDGRKIVFFEVDPAPPHLAPIMTSTGDIYARDGARDIRLTEDQSLELVRQSGSLNQQSPSRHPLRQTMHRLRSDVVP